MEDNAELSRNMHARSLSSESDNDDAFWDKVRQGFTVEDHFRLSPVSVETPLSSAAKEVSRWAQQTFGSELDADQTLIVTLNIEFLSSFPHRANVVNSMTLPEAMLRNWQQEGSGDWLDHLGQLRPYREGGYESKVVDEKLPDFDCEAYEALYRKTTPQRYDATTHLDISPVQFKKFVWDANFQSRYLGYLHEFWADNVATYPEMLKAGLFRAACLQEQENSLGSSEKAMVCEALGIPGNEVWETLPYSDFENAIPSPVVTLSELSVYGYKAADIVVIRSPHTRKVLLYVPGNSSPIHTFDNEQALQAWVANVCKDSNKRRSFENHFSAVDDIDGSFYSGLNTALKGFAVFPKNLNQATGRWDARQWVTIGAPLNFHPFVHLMNNIKTKSESDAHQKIHTRSDYWKEEVSSGLSESISVLGGVVMIVPELMPVLAGLSVMLVGLGVDEAVEGRTVEDRTKGWSRVIFGVLNAAPYLADGSSVIESGVLPELEEAAETGAGSEASADPDKLPPEPQVVPLPTRPEPPGLRSLDGRMRRLLGKLESSERLPVNMRNRANGVYYRDSKGYIEIHEKTYRVEWVASQEQYRIRTDANPRNWGPFVKVDEAGYWDLDLKLGLRGGQSFDGATLPLLNDIPEIVLPEREVIPPQPLEPQVQVELPLDGIEVDIVSGVENGQPKERYFIQIDGKRTRVYFDADIACWRKTASDTDLVWRTQSEEWVQGSTKAYKKVEHKLPVSAKSEVYRFPRLPKISSDATPIPRNIHHIWMGERLPGEGLIANIKQNMERAGDVTFTFHIDIEEAGAFEKLSAHFADYPNMRISKLSDEPFFAQVLNGENAPEFHYFRYGKNRNYAAASDILRYQLIYEYGGIYMDCDDEVLTSFVGVALLGGPYDVLLGDTVSASQLSYFGPNNSHFASQAKNPVLKNMSKEIRRRFLQEDKEFLAAPRPYVENTNEKIFELSGARMKLYMTRISDLTGPKLFSDMIRECRPDYFALLDYSRLPGDDVLSLTYIDRRTKATDHYFPFNKRPKISVGSANEWTKAPVVSDPIIAEPEPLMPVIDRTVEPSTAELTQRARTQPDSPDIDVHLPVDGIEEVGGRYYIQLNARKKAVVYDADLEVWALAENEQAVVTRDRDGDWQLGRGVEPQLPSANAEFQVITMPRLPEIPSNTLPIPRRIHYIWLGSNPLPDELVANLIKNAKNSPDFMSILHVDVDSQATLKAIRASLKGKASSLSVSNLKEGKFFQEFLESENAEIFHKARKGAGKNYAAAADIIRYPLMDYEGGMYMDTDESFVRSIKGLVFEAAPDDLLLGKEVTVPSLDFVGYNNSCFATQPGNRVLARLSRELRSRYLKSPDFFDIPVPVVDHSTAQTELISKQALGPYKKKVFELTGPSLFNDVLRDQRPDYYSVGVGRPADVFVRSKAYTARYNEVLDHYFPFTNKAPVNVGNAHSW